LYFVVKVTSGQERIAANMLQNKITTQDSPIYSILVVVGVRGYLIIEAENEIVVVTVYTYYF
jgi:transcriptional antiterminator NusG